MARAWTLLYIENLKPDIGTLGRRARKMGEGARRVGTEKNGKRAMKSTEGSEPSGRGWN